MFYPDCSPVCQIHALQNCYTNAVMVHLSFPDVIKICAVQAVPGQEDCQTR